MLNSSSFTGAGIVISVSDHAMALPFGLYQPPYIQRCVATKDSPVRVLLGE